MTTFLNNLPSIPNDLFRGEDRVCNICWEPYASDAPASSSALDPDEIRSSALTSRVTLVEACTFAKNESFSMSGIMVKTDICVEHEVLAETYTRSRMCDRDQVSSSKGDDETNTLNQAEEPVRLRCGHIFGRKCLRIWFVFFHYFDDYRSLLSDRFSGCPAGDVQDTCPLCRDNVLGLEPESERGHGTLSDHRQRVRDVLRIIQKAVRWNLWTILNQIHERRRSNKAESRRNNGQPAILSLNVR